MFSLGLLPWKHCVFQVGILPLRLLLVSVQQRGDTTRAVVLGGEVSS